MNKKIFYLFIFALILILPSTFAQEEEFQDLEVFGFELEKLLFFGSAHLAALLAILTFIAYHRTKNSRLIIITIAFSLFSIKLFMKSSELFIEEFAWIDPVSAFLDFAILVTFFYGVIKK